MNKKKEAREDVRAANRKGWRDGMEGKPCRPPRLNNKAYRTGYNEGRDQRREGMGHG